MAEASSTQEQAAPPPHSAVEDALASALAASVAARALTTSAGDCLQAARAVAQRQLAEHPYAALGVAAGIGFVVSGGLASSLARNALGFGARAAFAAASRHVMAAVLAPNLAPDTDVAAPLTDQANGAPHE